MGKGPQNADFSDGSDGKATLCKGDKNGQSSDVSNTPFNKGNFGKTE